MKNKTVTLINSDRDLDTAERVMNDCTYNGIEAIRIDTDSKTICCEEEIKIKDYKSQLKELIAIKIETNGQHILKVDNYQDGFREIFKYVILNNAPKDTRYKGSKTLTVG